MRARLHRVAAGLRALLSPARAERELDEELRAYLEAAIEAGMARGLDRAAAERAARLELGSVEAVKDHVRDVGWETRADAWVQDLRYAARTLRRSPAFVTASVLTLALGIGANTAIFTVINAVMLRTLPVPEPDRLVMVTSGERGFNTFAWNDIAAQAAPFGTPAAIAQLTYSLTSSGERVPIEIAHVSGSFFEALGIPAVRGRMIAPADDVRGGGPDGAVVVLGYEFWQRRYGGAGDVIGRRLEIDGAAFTIIGIAPPRFLGIDIGRRFDAAVPLTSEPLLHTEDPILDGRQASWLRVLVRLGPGQSPEALQAALRAAQPRIRAAAIFEGFPDAQALFMSDPFEVVPARTGVSRLREQYQQPLLILLALVGFVLLVACANVANLQLARAGTRMGDVRLRLALGASHWRVARQWAAESLFISVAGGSAGLLVGTWASRGLTGLLRTTRTPMSLDLSLDLRVVGFTAGATILTTLLFGTAPAWRVSRTRAPLGLRAPASAPAGRLPGLLAVFQVAVSLVLVVVAALLIVSFVRLAGQPLGYDPDPVLTTQVDITHVPVPDTARYQLFERLTAAVVERPDIVAASASIGTTTSGVGDAHLLLPAAGGGRSDLRAGWTVTGPGWFETYGVPLRAGRDFDASDRADSLGVAIVNEAFVRRYFPDRNPVGETLELRVGLGDAVTMGVRRIVGVSADVIYRPLRAAATPLVYMPIAQIEHFFPLPQGFQLSARGRTRTATAIARSVSAALTATDPRVSFTFAPIDSQLDELVTNERALALLSGAFAALALLLGAVGVYGLTAYGVASRRHEIGVRMAVGATRVDVVRLFVGRSVGLTGVGILVGLAGAAAATPLVRSLLFGIDPIDPAAFAGAALLFLAVATGAAWLPARRATRIDPALTLRCD